MTVNLAEEVLRIKLKPSFFAKDVQIKRVVHNFRVRWYKRNKVKLNMMKYKHRLL